MRVGWVSSPLGVIELKDSAGGTGYIEYVSLSVLGEFQEPADYHICKLANR